MVSCGLTWRSVKRSVLGAASAESAGIMSDQSVLLRITIVRRLRQGPSVDVGEGRRASTCPKCQIFMYLFTYLFIEPACRTGISFEFDDQTIWRRETAEVRTGSLRARVCTPRM